MESAKAGAAAAAGDRPILGPIPVVASVGGVFGAAFKASEYRHGIACANGVVQIPVGECFGWFVHTSYYGMPKESPRMP